MGKVKQIFFYFLILINQFTAFMLAPPALSLALHPFYPFFSLMPLKKGIRYRLHHSITSATTGSIDH